MSVPFVILSVVFAAISVALICAILLQKKRDAGGVGSIAGMGNVSETYWDRNKGRSMEGSLEKWTKVGGAVLAVLAIVLCLV